MGISTNGALSAEIKPGVSLGPFVLGESMHNIMGLIRKNSSVFPKIEVVYCPERITRMPIVVILPHNGLRLQFSVRKQYLVLIEVLEWNKTKLFYKGSELGKQGALSFKQIYHKVFGPTYLGVYNEYFESYILSYPGIGFNFMIPIDDSECTKQTDTVMKYLSQQSAPTCKEFAIFHGSSWPAEQESESLMDSPLDPLSFISQATKESETLLEISLITFDKDKKKLGIYFIQYESSTSPKPVDLVIGETSMKYVATALGPPEERFVKQDSRLLIHQESSMADENESLVIFNYFGFGIDICFDTSILGAPIKKIVLHTNTPGSLQFQKYKKCHWVIDGNHANQRFDSTTWADTTSTMIINQQLESPSSSVEWVGDDDNHNNNNNGNENTSPEAEDYGVTSLYGTEGFVFEVVTVTGMISTVTLF